METPACKKYQKYTSKDLNKIEIIYQAKTYLNSFMPNSQGKIENLSVESLSILGKFI